MNATLLGCAILCSLLVLLYVFIGQYGSLPPLMKTLMFFPLRSQPLLKAKTLQVFHS